MRGDLPSVPQSGEEDMEQEAGGDRGQEGGAEGLGAGSKSGGGGGGWRVVFV